MLIRIIGGGQDGVDVAALRAAKAVGLETGGWMPKGFHAGSGAHPDYASTFHLEATAGRAVSSSVHLNVQDADALLLLCFHPSPETALALRYARRQWKRLLVLTMACDGAGVFEAAYAAGAYDREGKRIIAAYRTPNQWAMEVQRVGGWLATNEVVTVMGNYDAPEAATEEWLVKLFRVVLEGRGQP